MGFTVTHANGRLNAKFRLKNMDALMAELDADGEASVSLENEGGLLIAYASGLVVFEFEGEVRHRLDQSRNVAKRLITQLAGNNHYWLKSLTWEPGRPS